MVMKDLKKEAISILLNSLKKNDIETLIKEKVQVCDEKFLLGGEEIFLPDFQEVLLIGFGKASLEMGLPLESLLQDKITRGILVTNRHNNRGFQSEVIVAGHPTPNESSLTAAEKILSAIKASTEKTLIIFLISGGGSSLVELPLHGITLKEIQQVNKILVGGGATIQEINILRKRLSQIKGGKLACFAKKMRSVAIYVSDVNEGDLSSLASGPLYTDQGSSGQFKSIVKKYGLLEKVPSSIASILKQEMVAKPDNLKKKGKPNISHLLLLENADLLKIAAKTATKRGWKVEISRDLVEGKYQNVADELLKRLVILQEKYPNKPVCLISGGEVECPVQANGIGGRNQEFVLYSATRFSLIGNHLEVAVLSCGTDGVDGGSSATGAVVSNVDFYKSNRLGIDASSFIDQNDSHSFLKQSGGLLVVGPTGNNVRDVRILLARPKTITKENQK
jgi:glycerate 2-kinase